MPPHLRLRTGESGQNDGVPIVHACSHPDCSTLTMGEVCLEHEPVPAEAGLAGESEVAPNFVEVALDPVPR